MDDHKVFRIREISNNIVEQIGKHTIEKQLVTGQTYFTEETESTLWRKITHVSRLWWMTYRNKAIDMEYYERNGYNMNFCNLCERYETNISRDTPEHQNCRQPVGRQQRAVITKSYQTITWNCNKGCQIHCAQNPGHCQNGIMAEYHIKTPEEYETWKQRQIRLKDRKRELKIKEILAKAYKEDRNVSKRLKYIKNNNGKSKLINLCIELKQDT